MRNHRQPPRSRREYANGFTLIELLIVVAIIGIISAIAIPGLLNAIEKSRQTSSAALMRGYGEALEVYNADNQMYPNVTTVLDLVPHLLPYSESLDHVDEWRHPLAYAVNADLDSYSLECYGRDGADGLDVTPQTRYFFERDIIYSNGAFVNGIE